MIHQSVFFYYSFGIFIIIASINPYIDKVEVVDYSASVFDVQNLARHEQKFIKILIEYKNELKRKLNLIDSYIDNFESSLIPDLRNLSFINVLKTDINTSAMNFIDHPLKIYHLLRRFTKTLPIIEKEIENNNNNMNFLNSVASLKKLFKFPNNEDLQSSMFSLIRLKQTYNISMNELAIGNLNGFITNSGLTSQNCFEIGQKAVEQEVFSTAIEFFETALHLHSLSSETKKSLNFEDKKRTLEKTIKTHDKFLSSGKFDHDENPFHFTNPLHSSNHVNFERKIIANIPSIETSKILTMRIASAAFDKLCRQENIQNASVTAELKCVYLNYRNKKTHLFYILSPLKIEIHNINPPLIQIYDVLSENEMELIKNEAQPELLRSRIQSLNPNSKGNVTYFRTSTNTWIYDFEPGSPFGFINKRVQMITGLTLEHPTTSCEILQIANYAPGGFYTSHYDAAHEKIFQNLDPQEILMGDRIATFMFYLSDVKLGGGTAFPLLGVSTQPIKGSAVFWYNLHSDGSIHRRMLHGGCPVLYGNKWVANKWIRSNDQMFTKKCPTKQTKDIWF